MVNYAKIGLIDVDHLDLCEQCSVASFGFCMILQWNKYCSGYARKSRLKVQGNIVVCSDAVVQSMLQNHQC